MGFCFHFCSKFSKQKLKIQSFLFTFHMVVRVCFSKYISANWGTAATLTREFEDSKSENNVRQCSNVWIAVGVHPPDMGQSWGVKNSPKRSPYDSIRKMLYPPWGGCLVRLAEIRPRQQIFSRNSTLWFPPPHFLLQKGEFQLVV